VRLLIDECIDERLRHLFAGHDCQTARYARLNGLQNGQLIVAAEAAGFEVIVTVDQNIPYQQNLGVRKIALLILCAPTKSPPRSAANRSCRAGRSFSNSTGPDCEGALAMANRHE
jgi:hypothetical protein